MIERVGSGVCADARAENVEVMAVKMDRVQDGDGPDVASDFLDDPVVPLYTQVSQALTVKVSDMVLLTWRPVGRDIRFSLEG